MKTLVRSLVQLGRQVLGRSALQAGFAGQTLEQDDLELAREWLRHGDAWRDRSVVRDYEAAFADFNTSKHAYAFRSGREALSACLAALQLTSPSEVVLPGYTCVTVPNAIRFAGLTPVFADIELETFGMDVEALRRCLTPRTGAILLHHLYGLVCRDHHKILELARSMHIPVIEDCAHATGARIDGTTVGNHGDLAFYSSEQSKAFCSVMGGVAATNNDVLADRLEQQRSQAPWPDPAWTRNALENVCLLHQGRANLVSTSAGETRFERPMDYGQAMPAPLAALARQQLEKLPAINERRRAAAQCWHAWCDAHGYRRPLVVAASEPIFLRYPVLVEPERKQDLRWAERELGFRPGRWFEGNLHPVHIELPQCPNGNEAVARCINLPTLMP